ncbi:MAG: PstS family phosphate ABC transporter substrate-binding protein [Geitlerinemataceae cyanobacterium]
MSGKNETATLAIALLVTLGLLGVGVWLFRQPLSQLLDNSPSSRTSNNSQKTYKTFAEVPDVPSGLFNYGGSTTWAPIRKDLDSAIQTVHPSFQLRYTNPTAGTPGSGSGIRMLLQDQLAFSQSSRSLKDEEYQQAKQRGFSLEQIPVAIDGIAIAVHPDLEVPGLTISQLQEIYAGNITNWNQVDGPNLPIIPYSRRPEDGGTVEFFMENVLGDKEFSQNVEFVPTTTQALRLVSQNLGSLYYASAPEVVPQCTIKTLPIGRQAQQWVKPYQEPRMSPQDCLNGKPNQLNASAFQSGDYPITRRLFVIVKQNGQIDRQAGEAYAHLLLTEQGQELITQAGFVRLQ